MNNQAAVRCASGYTYAEKPLAFHYAGSEYQVGRIGREWRTPGRKAFLVQETGGLVFELMYDTDKDEWQITPRGETVIR